MWGQIIGAGISAASSLFGAKSNEKLQKDFAQKGIQWKVADAKKAGIHPLAALGASTHSFAPNNVGSELASAGQDLGRAIDAERTKSERVDGYTAQARNLALQKAGLENDILRTELASRVARVRQAGQPPARPTVDPNQHLIPGQGDSPGIKDKALERAGWNNANPHAEAGAISDIGFSKTPTGWAPTQSNDFKQRSEEDPWAIAGHWARHRIPPSFQMGFHPPFEPGTGRYWIYHPFKQEYQLREYFRGPGRYSPGRKIGQ